MSYWTKRRKINASVAKQIASLSENHCAEYEHQGLPCESAPIADVVDAVDCDCTASGDNNNTGSDDSFVVNSVHSINDVSLDNDIGKKVNLMLIPQKILVHLI